ncbi:MAG: hypothetical protein D6820_05555 [Lentisphaerae bacterium]|nr:MAG: hypothetical protein D6820_05555 [Lentisphaerota bacterium]
MKKEILNILCSIVIAASAVAGDEKEVTVTSSTEVTQKKAKSAQIERELSVQTAKGHGFSQTNQITVERTGDGSASWTAEKERVWNNGATATAETTGTVTKTEDGREWTATTSGTNAKGVEFTGERTGSVTKNEDGSRTIEVEYSRTNENGKTISGERELTVTRTEEGRSWEMEATRTGPRGTSEVTGSGTAQRTEDGVSWTAQREGTGPNGNQWERQTSGTAQRTEEGRQWNATTTRSNSAGQSRTVEREGTASRSRSGCSNTTCTRSASRARGSYGRSFTERKSVLSERKTRAKSRSRTTSRSRRRRK